MNISLNDTQVDFKLSSIKQKQVGKKIGSLKICHELKPYVGCSNNTQGYKLGFSL